MNLFAQTVSALGGYRGQIVMAIQGPDMLGRDGKSSRVVVWESEIWENDAEGALEEAQEKLSDVITGLFA